MGRKKKKSTKGCIWCFYCDREFDNEKVLIDHQKAKHFKCKICYKKLSTAGGLIVHMEQVHKEVIQSVHNALKDRASVDFEVYGMGGIPQKFLDSRKGGPSQKKAKVSVAAPPARPASLLPPPRAALPPLPMAPPPLPQFGVRPPYNGGMPPRPPYGYPPPPRPQWPMPPSHHMYPQPHRGPPRPPYASQQPQMYPPRPPMPAPGGWLGSVPRPPPAHHPQAVPPPAGPSVQLIFEGADEVSMEEKRAMQSKYAPSTASASGSAAPAAPVGLMDKLSKLDQSLGDRLAFLKK